MLKFVLLLIATLAALSTVNAQWGMMDPGMGYGMGGYGMGGYGMGGMGMGGMGGWGGGWRRRMWGGYGGYGWGKKR